MLDSIGCSILVPPLYVFSVSLAYCLVYYGTVCVIVLFISRAHHSFPHVIYSSSPVSNRVLGPSRFHSATVFSRVRSERDPARDGGRQPRPSTSLHICVTATATFARTACKRTPRSCLFILFRLPRKSFRFVAFLYISQEDCGRTEPAAQSSYAARPDRKE